MSLSPGARLGPYEILSPLGAGGMGEVYRARDSRLGREVAIKALPVEVASDASRLKRFEKEARAASALSHPNIVTIYDIGVADSIPYMAMELVSGKTLRELIAEGPLPMLRLLGAAIQIAEGLSKAHAAGIIHRDLKPENVMMTRDGLVKILDFGLAKLARPGLEEGQDTRTPTVSEGTRPGIVMGTVGYMSPEQASGHPVDFRSDQFSFGSILYEMASGRRAFQKTTGVDTLAAILHEEPEPLERVASGVPASVRWIVERCLAKEPEERYDSTRDLARDLASCRAHLPETGVAITAPATAGTRGRSHRLMAVAVGAALLTLGGFWFLRRARHVEPISTRWERLTDFTDSVTSPALSPDGRMLAFIRGSDTFIGLGQVYVKLLPDGEPVQLTDDSLKKMSPVFSPDGSRIAYTAAPWDTWVVPVFGGRPRIWLPNASGLTWMDRDHVLFSEIKKGTHMGIVTATESRAEARDVYVPASGWGMAHRSYFSPDRKWIVTAEMAGRWLPCRLLPFDGSSSGKTIGPQGNPCTSAAWTPDGRWIYLTANGGDGFHIWRQRFPGGRLARVTSGTTEEDGVAMAPDGRSFITSVGNVQSTIWIQHPLGQRQVSSEGYATFGFLSVARSSFSADGRKLYYLMRQKSAGDYEEGELFVVEIDSGHTERLLPGFTMKDFDVSADGRLVAFTVRDRNQRSQLWLGSLERRFPPRQLSPSGVDEIRPIFVRTGEIFVMDYASNSTRPIYIIRPDGGRERIRPDVEGLLESASPDGEWITLRTSRPSPSEGEGRPPHDAYPVREGVPVRVCQGCNAVKWAADGRFLYISFAGMGLQIGAGKTVALPVPPGKHLPDLPASGVKTPEEAAALPGATVIEQGNISPGKDPSTYAFTKVTAQRNLYRVPIPH